jgi:hypothetical protein
MKNALAIKEALQLLKKAQEGSPVVGAYLDQAIAVLEQAHLDSSTLVPMWVGIRLKTEISNDLKVALTEAVFTALEECLNTHGLLPKVKDPVIESIRVVGPLGDEHTAIMPG